MGEEDLFFFAGLPDPPENPSYYTTMGAEGHALPCGGRLAFAMVGVVNDDPELEIADFALYFFEPQL